MKRPVKRALLIGINSYPFAPLNGCCNDVEDMREYLLQNGFLKRHIKVLTNKRANAVSILRAIDNAISITGPEDSLYIHYSGHGTQVPAVTDEEPDGLDECLCPVDFNFTPETTITDNQLAALFRKKRSTAKILFFSDSCHSGDLNREGHKVRTFHSFLDVLAKIFTKKESTPFQEASLPNFAIISAARADQTAADTTFDGRANGAGTYFFLQALKQSPQRNLQGLVKFMNTQLAHFGYSQEAQIIGTDILPIL